MLPVATGIHGYQDNSSQSVFTDALPVSASVQHIAMYSHNLSNVHCYRTSCCDNGASRQAQVQSKWQEYTDWECTCTMQVIVVPQITKFMGPTWDPPGSCRTQMGPMMTPWNLLSGTFLWYANRGKMSLMDVSAFVAMTPLTTRNPWPVRLMLLESDLTKRFVVQLIQHLFIRKNIVSLKGVKLYSAFNLI